MGEVPLKVWLEREGALLRLRLARPKANIIDAAMIGALRAAFDEHRGNTGLLAALVDHEGPHFSFGASVEEHLPERCAEMLSSLHALLGSMLEWPKPILVCAAGQCLGGGLEFAAAGHLLFAAPDVRDRLSQLGLESRPNSPADFAAFLREEVPKWAKAVKDSGAKAD